MAKVETQSVKASEVGDVATVLGTAPKKFDPAAVKVVKQVSTNLLKMKVGTTVYVTITEKLHKAKISRADEAAAKKDPTAKVKEPPTLLPVVNLETGEVQTIIAGTVLVDLLNDEYPSDSYVKKSFMIATVQKKDAQGGGGRSYNTYDVKEIAP